MSNETLQMLQTLSLYFLVGIPSLFLAYRTAIYGKNAIRALKAREPLPPIPQKIATILVLAVSLIAFQIARNWPGNDGEAVDEALIEAASQLNAKLPMMVDSDTRLDNTMGLNKTLRYNYTLVNYTASSVSAADINNALGQKILNQVCTSKEMRGFIKNGVTVSYAYHGNEGSQITVISVDPSQCGSASP